MVARFGGEEFVILLDNCSLSDTKDKAELLRMNIEQLTPENILVTASFGIAELRKDESFEQLITRADEALYLAKEQGRNCIFEATEC